MDRIRKILAPTDLSELSQVGIRYALDFAKAIEAEVTVYHVVDYDSSPATAKGPLPHPRFSRLITTSWRDIKKPYSDS